MTYLAKTFSRAVSFSQNCLCVRARTRAYVRESDFRRALLTHRDVLDDIFPSCV